MEQESGDYIQNTRISNHRAEPLTLVFEPWFSTYEIPAGEHVVVSSRGPIGDGIEAALYEDHCTVWGWSGSSTVILHNGEIVIDWRELRMPAIPVPSLRELGESLWKDVKEADLG